MSYFSCPICIDDLKTSDDIVCTLCGHIYHSQCLKAWLSKSKTCPECRCSLESKRPFKKIFPNETDDSHPVKISQKRKIEMLEARVESLEKELADQKKINKDLMKKRPKSPPKGKSAKRKRN